MAKKKIFIVLTAMLLLSLVLVAGAGIYLFNHPSTTRSFLEKAGQSFLGSRFSIQKLSYSLNPPALHAENIRLHREGPQSPFSFELKRLDAGFSLKGSFGGRTLVCHTLEIDGLSCEIYETKRRKTAPPEPETGSFLMKVARKAVSFFLFDQVTLLSAHLRNAKATAALKDQTLRVSHLSASINKDHLIDLTGGIHFEWPSKHISLAIPAFFAKTQQPLSFDKPRVTCTFSFKEGRFNSPEILARGATGTAALDYDHSKHALGFDPVSLSFSKIEIPHLPGTKKEPLQMTLEASGKINTQQKSALIHHVVLNVDDLLKTDGLLKTRLFPKPEFQIRFCKGHIFAAKVLHLLGPALGPARRWHVSGPVDFSGNLSGARKTRNWSLTCGLDARLSENALHYKAPHMDLSGNISGRAQVNGPISNPAISGRCDLTNGVFNGMGLFMPDFKCGFAFSGSPSAMDFKNIVMEAPVAETNALTKSPPMENIKVLSPEGRLDVKTQTVSIPKMHFDSSLVQNLRLSFALARDRLKLDVTGQHTGLLSFAKRLRLLPEQWKFTEDDDVTLHARLVQADQLTLSAAYQLNNISFNSPDQTHMGENVSLKTHISGSGSLKKRAFQFKTSLKAHHGELLLDRFYFDLRKTPLSLSLQGNFLIPEHRLKLTDFKMALEKIISLRARGDVFKTDAGIAAEGFLEIADTPAKPLFRHLIQEPFQIEKPSLSAMALAGNIKARLNVKKHPLAWSASGFLNWQKGSLLVHDPNILISGIDLSLPLIAAKGALFSSDKSLEGGLNIRNLRVPFLPEQSISLSIGATQNHWHIPSPISLAVPGGTIYLGPTDISSREGTRTALHFQDLNLKPILSSVWPATVEGSAHGNLLPIRIHKNRLTPHGNITANVFGGSVDLSNISLRGLLTPVPVLRLNVRWQNINLARLTHQTSFGKVEGILNGYAKNLEIANGQPQRFDLLMETVKTDGVPQKISVKAVDNIARLGGGESPFAGIAGLFISFFKEFPYRKIGVKASLENDLFKINGAIHESGKEYLVKRGFFSGVDVINESRGNRVGFKDMLKRIKRVTDAKSSPVIK